MPQITRRNFAAVLATPALLSAQAPAAAAEDLAAVARNQNKANSDRLNQFKMDMAVEPAFAFKP